MDDDLKPVAKDGELVLYANADQSEGVLRDTLRDTESPRQPLQVFFKWGNFEPIESSAEAST